MSNYTKYINAYYNLAEKLLDVYWCGPKGWDKGSNAHLFALRWVKNNWKDIKNKSFEHNYNLYLKTLVQE